MTIHQFLALFPHAKETKKGWDVNCPAHDDRNPSLGVMEGDDGRIVLNCFAGCMPMAICAALGLTLADLFADSPINGHPKPLPVFAKPVSKRALAFAYDLHALDLREHARKIFEAAALCDDCDTWTDADREWAMKAVAQAYISQERAYFCETYADHVREEAYELKRLASH